MAVNIKSDRYLSIYDEWFSYSRIHAQEIGGLIGIYFEEFQRKLSEPFIDPFYISEKISRPTCKWGQKIRGTQDLITVLIVNLGWKILKAVQDRVK